VIYERTLAIGQRFAAMLDLIRAGQHSTRTLAAALSVSEPTISRCLAALRHRGYQIEPQQRQVCQIILRQVLAAQMSMHETQAAEATLRYAHTLKVGQLDPMIVADHDIFDMALAIDQHTDLSACFVRQLS
jgi:biotin operon repressor